MNTTIVLNRLTAARAEGGNAHAVTQAQALVQEHFPNRTFDVETPVNRVFNALDRFDRAGAETAINEALATLNQPEPAVVADTAAATDTTGLEARVAALEAIARQNGMGHLVARTAQETTLEARVAALEGAARSRGLL